MDFTVYALGGSKDFSGDSRFSIDDANGVLTVYADDDTRYQYSPAHWELVKDRPENW